MSNDNDYSRSVHFDNADVRYADTTKFGNIDVLYGLTVNNSPTVQDPWNTPPVWSFPFIASPFQAAEAPAATMIESLGQTVLGAGSYVFINDMLYAEIAGYGAQTPRVQRLFGEAINTEFTVDGVAPYYRLALEPVWGDFAWEIGTYGMAANILPNRVFGFGTNKIFDAGFDSQFQWIGDMHNVTLRGNYIFERQILELDICTGKFGQPCRLSPQSEIFGGIRLRSYLRHQRRAVSADGHTRRFRLLVVPEFSTKYSGMDRGRFLFAVFAWSARPLAVLQHAHWPRLYLFLAVERLEQLFRSYRIPERQRQQLSCCLFLYRLLSKGLIKILTPGCKAGRFSFARSLHSSPRRYAGIPGRRDLQPCHIVVR